MHAAEMLARTTFFDDLSPEDVAELTQPIVAAFQGPVTRMSQNRQSLKDRAQAETDFKVIIKNEVGIETLVRGFTEVKAHLARLEKGVNAGRPTREGLRPGPGSSDTT